MPTIRRVSALAAALLALGGLAACSDTSGSAEATGPATAASPNGVADQPPEEILAASQAAAESATSYRAVSRVSIRGVEETFDLQFSPDGATGTMTDGGSSLEVIVTPQTVYLKGDAEVTEQASGAMAGETLDGKWLGIPTSAKQAKPYRPFVDGTQFVQNVLTPSSSMELGTTSEVNGTPAIVIKSTRGSLWVATVGEPYPLQIKGTDGKSEITFSDWNVPVTVAPPPEDEVVMLEEPIRAG